MNCGSILAPCALKHDLAAGAESFWKSTVYAFLTLLAFRASYKEKYACSAGPVLSVCCP